MRCFLTVSSESDPSTIYAPIRTRYTRASHEIASLATQRIVSQKSFAHSTVPLELVILIDTHSILLRAVLDHKLSNAPAKLVSTYVLKNQTSIRKLAKMILFVRVFLYIFDIVEESNSVIYFFLICLYLFQFFGEFYLCFFVTFFEILEFLEKRRYSCCKGLMIF